MIYRPKHNTTKKTIIRRSHLRIERIKKRRRPKGKFGRKLTKEQRDLIEMERGRKELRMRLEEGQKKCANIRNESHILKIRKSDKMPTVPVGFKFLTRDRIRKKLKQKEPEKLKIQLFNVNKKLTIPISPKFTKKRENRPNTAPQLELSEIQDKKLRTENVKRKSLSNLGKDFTPTVPKSPKFSERLKSKNSKVEACEKPKKTRKQTNGKTVAVSPVLQTKKRAKNNKSIKSEKLFTKRKQKKCKKSRRKKKLSTRSKIERRASEQIDVDAWEVEGLTYDEEGFITSKPFELSPPHIQKSKLVTEADSRKLLEFKQRQKELREKFSVLKKKHKEVQDSADQRTMQIKREGKETDV